MQLLSLNGEWALTYQSLSRPEEWWGRWIPAIVPGDVHLDLLRAGLICEPLVSDNNTKYRWIEEKAWWYARVFHLPDGFIGRRVELVCDGLDLTAEIWINGVRVGSANTMFVQHRFDVTEALRPGGNEIRVRLDVGFEAVKDAPTEKFVKSWGREEPRRPWMRKAQQAFYWDTAPRLVTCGIWRDIALESYDGFILRDVYVTSTFDDWAATVNVALEIDSLLSEESPCLVQVRLCDQETDVTERKMLAPQPGSNTAHLSLEVVHPRLWWPNGMGEPHLYQVTVQVWDAAQTILYDEKNLRHGLRSLEIVQEPLNEEEKTFTVVVNGRKVFCKGGNWVPSDAIYARINRDKEYRLLKYAREANFNMLRVWGGGVYPDTFFYDICDELGIMVWQDFMYACAYYPDDEPAFCEAAREEAEKVVRKFRNHASLALWCGNNETYMMHARVNPEGTFYGLKIYSEILPEVCKRLDPQRYYHPSSPYPGPWPGQEKQGDQHIWSHVLGWHDLQKSQACDFSPEEMATVMQLWRIPELNYKFVSEFGIFCPSNRASMHKFMGEHPLDLRSPIYQHHRNHFEADFILEMLRRYYKRREAYSLDEFIIAGQMCQAEAIKYILEELRSRMYVCSGALFWEYNDTWGHVGYSPVDYYLNLKPLYFYMQRAFAPLHVVFKEQGALVYLLNDTPQERHVEIEFGCQTFWGEIIFQERKPVYINPCCAVEVADLSAALTSVSDRRRAFVYARVFDAQGQLLDRNRQFLVPIQDVQMPEDTMICEITRVDTRTWQVDLAAKHFVWMVKIDADENLECSDNAFDLWPGEHKSVHVCAERVYPGLELRVENINQYIHR